MAAYYSGKPVQIDLGQKRLPGQLDARKLEALQLDGPPKNLDFSARGTIPRSSD